MTDKKSLFRKVINALAAVFEGEGEQERAVSLSRLYDNVMGALYRADPEAWPTDIYQDGAEMYLVYASGGKLYRADITAAGEEITLGAPVQVTENHPPANRMIVSRAADGSARWFLQAATATLDRMGEIDSTALFDTFVERAKASGNYPLLDFCHEEELVIGKADFVARDDFVYIASGTFDADNPIAQAVMRDAEVNPGYWGASITYHPDGEPEMVEISDGIQVPVYTAGTNTRIAILPEKRACSWLTSLAIPEVNRMKDETLKELERLLGKEKAAELAGGVDATNRAIVDNGMITREGEAEEAPAAEETPAVEQAEEQAAATPVMEIDETVIAAVSEKVKAEMQKAYDDLAAQVNQGIADLKAALDALTPQQAEATREIAAIKDQVKSLAETDAEKQRRWLEDQPRRENVRVTYRPRIENDVTGDKPAPTLADVAADTLSKISKP